MFFVGYSKAVNARRSISRVLSASRMRDGHSSGTSVAGRLLRPTRAAARRPARRPLRSACRSYLVLLPVGFSLPPPLPAARCALAAPFHPCRAATAAASARRCIFCGTIPGVAPAGGYPAPCLRGARTFLSPKGAAIRPSGSCYMVRTRSAGERRGPIFRPRRRPTATAAAGG